MGVSSKVVEPSDPGPHNSGSCLDAPEECLWKGDTVVLPAILPAVFDCVLCLQPLRPTFFASLHVREFSEEKGNRIYFGW